MRLRERPRKRPQGAACGEFPLCVPSSGCHNNRPLRHPPSPAACLDDLCALLAGHVCPTAQKRASPDQHVALDTAAEDGGKGGVAKQKRGRPSMAESLKKVSEHLRRGQYLRTYSEHMRVLVSACVCPFLQLDMGDVAELQRRIVVLEGENNNLRASNAAFTREAKKLEWRGASVFDDEFTDVWPSTGAGRTAKSYAVALVRRALAAACCSGSGRVSSGRSRRSSGRRSAGSALNGDSSEDENERELPDFGPSSATVGGGGAGSSSAGDGGGVDLGGADGCPGRASVEKRRIILRVLLTDALQDATDAEALELLPLELRREIETDKFMLDCAKGRLAILSQCRTEDERQDFKLGLALLCPDVAKFGDAGGMQGRAAGRLEVARTGHMVKGGGYKPSAFEQACQIASAFAAEPAPWTPFAPRMGAEVLCRSGLGILKSIEDVLDPVTGTWARAPNCGWRGLLRSRAAVPGR